MATSLRVILSERAAWAVANDADVEENVQTASMMVRKSRVEMVIFCGGGAEVLVAAPSVGVVLGAGGPEKTKGKGAGGTGAGGGDSGTKVPKPEAPQYAPLAGATPQHEYRLPAGPLLGPKAEGEKSGA